MLPEALSADACSLVPREDRLAVTVELEGRGARVEKASFAGRSSAPTTGWTTSGSTACSRAPSGRIRRGRSRCAWPARSRAPCRRCGSARGGLVVDSREPEFSFDDAGQVVGVRHAEQTESHRLIEHLMIAANEAVAGLLEDRKIPTLYRVHDKPDPERIKQLVDQLASLDIPTPPVSDHLTPDQANEIVGEISRLVDQEVKRRGGRGRRAFTSLVLRSLKQAAYSPRNLGHAGLRVAAVLPLHVADPPLPGHRLPPGAAVGGRGRARTAPRASGLEEAGTWTSQREREAMLVERSADDVALCFLLERELVRAERQTASSTARSSA